MVGRLRRRWREATARHRHATAGAVRWRWALVSVPRLPEARTPVGTNRDVYRLEIDRERKIAPNFEHFLGMLTLSVTHSTFGILGVTSPDSIVDTLNTAFGVRFDNMSSWEHRYPVYRWPSGGAGSSNWIWLSPNRVRRGFVRENDPHYKDLADLLPGQRYVIRSTLTSILFYNARKLLPIK